MTEENAKEIVDNHKANRQKPKNIRDQAFEIMVRAITPAHMLDEPEPVPVKPVEPLEGISVSAARGIVEAVYGGLVSHARWIEIAPVFERISATAKT